MQVVSWTSKIDYSKDNSLLARGKEKGKVLSPSNRVIFLLELGLIKASMINFVKILVG
jgi:hypothetical protein